MNGVCADWTAKVHISVGTLGTFLFVVCVLIIQKCRCGRMFILQEIFSNLEMVSPYNRVLRVSNRDA